MRLALIPSLCLTSALGLLVWFLSGLLIFGGRIHADYVRPSEAVCNSWHTSEVFRPSPSGRLPTCAEAVAWPRHSEYLNTEENLQVRIVIPDEGPSTAIWLHVHGITDSYLNGMRYIKLAERLGFQLVLLELQNHGASTQHAQGSSWGCREKFDLFAAMNYLHRTWPNRPVLLTGTSMGTMTITQAVLSRPDAFTAVKGIIYESPLSSLENLSDRFCLLVPGSLCGFFLKTLIPFLTPLRTDTDFHRCFKDPWPPSEIPTELWLSRDEFKNPEQIALGSLMPGHKNLSIQIFEHGSHSAYYSYVPEAVEAALQAFWDRVKGLDAPDLPRPFAPVP